MALIAGHGTILYYFATHTALLAAVVTGNIIVLLVIKHLGVLGPLYALLRKTWRPPSG